MQEEDIAICNVFEGNEADWTEKLTGIRGIIYRAAMLRYENTSPEKLREYGRNTTRHMLEYHKNLSPEKKEATRLKQSNSHYKTKQNESPEFQKSIASKISKALVEYNKNRSPEQIQEQSIKLSKARARQEEEMDEESKLKRNKKISNTMKNYWASLSPEKREELSRKNSKGHLNPPEEYKDQLSRSSKRVQSQFSPEKWGEIKKLLSSKAKEARNNCSQEKKDSWTKNSGKGQRRIMTKPEAALGLYLSYTYPGKWAYNGQCQKDIVIGGKVPDFVNIENKEIIEVFGTYWHEIVEETELKAHYKALGWNCTILWEDQAFDLFNTIPLKNYLGLGNE